jgi:hypothetical protein
VVVDDPIERLTKELFIYHKLTTETERQVLREMVTAVFMDEICNLIAARMGGVN